VAGGATRGTSMLRGEWPPAPPASGDPLAFCGGVLAPPARSAHAPVASFLPVFRAALDAVDSSTSAKAARALVVGDESRRELVRKTQRVHELLRHLFALVKKARLLNQLERLEGQAGQGAAAAGAASSSVGAKDGGAHCLSAAELDKISRLEKRMEEVVGECRSEARKIAENQAQGSSSSANHSEGAVSSAEVVALWKSLERQLQHGFAAVDKVRCVDSGGQGGNGGWEVVS
jgi:hypothetical protein